MKATLLGMAAVLIFWGQAASGETREYLLGDMDNFIYEGPGSEDDVYVAPDFAEYVAGPGAAKVDFDVLGSYQIVPFTFRCELAPDETITTATLTLGLRATDSLVTTDKLHVYDHTTGINTKYAFDNMGWLPLPFSGVAERQQELSSIVGDNLIAMIEANERIDFHIHDDTAVDYAVLSLEVIPGITGDFSRDGVVDIADVNLLYGKLGTAAPPTAQMYDLAEDGAINYFDAEELITNIIGTSMADTDLDNDVDVMDLGNLAHRYNQSGGFGDGDCDANGAVNVLDLGILANDYGRSCSPLDCMSVPEPGSVGLLALGGLAALLPRYRRSTA